jgi:transcriptional regulator with XRE-family HTH domain
LTEVHKPGAILRLTREAAGFSLDTMVRRTHFSKCYLSCVETGKRRATPAVIQAYQAVLGDDMNRRQLLMALFAGAAAPSASVEVIGRAFESALDTPALTVDDWLAKLDDYGREYMASLGVGELQVRLAGDLAQLQTRLDDPVLSSVAAKLLTMYGLTFQSTATSDAFSQTSALRWYALGVRAADRSADLETQVWARGRAAQALATDDIHQHAVADLARQALALSEDRPSVGRLSAQLTLALAQSQARDRAGTLALLSDARRTFDVVGSSSAVSDFAFPEWRLEFWVSELSSRLGEERVAQEARGVIERMLPPTFPRFTTELELDRGLLMVKLGDVEGGRAYAREAFDQLPPEARWPSLRLMMSEIESATV